MEGDGSLAPQRVNLSAMVFLVVKRIQSGRLLSACLKPRHPDLILG